MAKAFQVWVQLQYGPKSVPFWHPACECATREDCDKEPKWHGEIGREIEECEASDPNADDGEYRLRLMEAGTAELR